MSKGYDVRRIALSACVGGALAAGLEFALPALAHTESEAGATASAIDTAAIFVAGAGIGSAIGALLASVLHRSQPKDVRFESGVFAGLIGGAAALLPPIVYTDPSDVFGMIFGLIISIFVVTPFVLAGAAVGTLLARNV